MSTSAACFADERRLALRQDEHAGDELERGRDRGEVAEEDEELVELVLGRVRPRPVRPRGDVGAEHVVVGEQVAVAQLLGRLRERAHRARVGADLGLRKDDAELHGRIIHHSRRGNVDLAVSTPAAAPRLAVVLVVAVGAVTGLVFSLLPNDKGGFKWPALERAGPGRHARPGRCR